MNENEFNKNTDAQNYGHVQENININQDQPSSASSQSETEMQSTKSLESKNTGSIIAIIIIVLVIIMGGLYFWGEKINNNYEDAPSITPEEIMTQTDEKTENLKQQSDSDLIADIEEDLGLTDLDGLDTELQNIDAEFNF